MFFNLAANGGHSFEITLKLKIRKLNLFLISMHAHTHLTHMIIVFMQIINLWGYFIYFGIIEKKKKKKKKSI